MPLTITIPAAVAVLMALHAIGRDVRSRRRCRRTTSALHRTGVGGGRRALARIIVPTNAFTEPPVDTVPAGVGWNRGLDAHVTDIPELTRLLLPLVPNERGRLPPVRVEAQLRNGVW